MHRICYRISGHRTDLELPAKAAPMIILGVIMEWPYIYLFLPFPTCITNTAKQQMQKSSNLPLQVKFKKSAF